jgi:uncharacterized protein (DUF2141 family)
MTCPRCVTRFETGLIALLMSAAAPATAATLTVEIGNVRNDHGHVHIDICPRDHFLKDDCPFGGDAPALPGVTAITVRDVPPGQYAVQAFHDENDNHRVDRALFGIPREGVGFSNDARISFGPPKWSDAMVAIAGDTRLRLSLRYFLGSAGPSPAH